MQAILFLAACAGAVNAALGVMEVDLVFPRNETYAPTEIFPLIFAFQNSELAPLLKPRLSEYHVLQFTIDKSGQEVDLVAATTNRNCTQDEAYDIDGTAVAINVPTTLVYGGTTCASMASTTPAPTPRQIKFDSAAASDMSSSMTSLACDQTRVPRSACPTPTETSDAQQLVGGGAAGFAAAFGAMGYMVV
ncbi:hypothetical protein BDW02DRAFT_579077 [Decorospora gaudefroyi]|uniref:DUF7136 domain-containing protein n=1 Tax=Decorospora gaudefroyi TaxID=184978 RepID=A0A6A5KNH3_9PLEO|nr:hypothetical protein BDW02DRAFT_579077 [Decorospora gaudefroyi]